MLLSSIAATPLYAAEIDGSLQRAMDAAKSGDTVRALLYLHDQLDVDALEAQFNAERATRAHRHQIVVDTLRATAELTQRDLLDSIMGMDDVVGHRAFWISNLVQVEATVPALRTLAEHDDVMLMYLDHPIELVGPVSPDLTESNPIIARGAVPEPGVEAVRAPECWDLGYDGSGVLVANLDTGVDGSHPTLASRWAGLRPEYGGNPEWAFLDPYNGNHGNPYDSGYHGTHTLGSVCGGSPGLPIGVAPGAHWIASAGIDQGGISSTVTSAIEAMEWMIDPDGNSSTIFDVPSVCSHSWGLVTSHGYPECDQTFWGFLDACEAAGTVILFSAGNEGSSGLRRPGDRATDEYRTCAVAAIDPYSGSWPVASFSSRGPTYCTETGTVAIKPDIAAPGVNTNSAYPGGSYTSLSGTSMASPHVNGVVAIMRQANPNLPVNQIKQIIYDTAYDLGSAGKDNDYGYGMIDAYAALEVVLTTINLTFNYPDGRPEFIEPSGGQSVVVNVSGPATPAPGTASLHYRLPGSIWTTAPLTVIDSDTFIAEFPSFECGATVQWFLSIETLDGDYITSPYDAPGGVWTGEAWSGIDVSFEDDFQSDSGWAVSGDATAGQWERAVPNGGGARCDPSADSDGSGACYVTGNGAGDTDIDGGSTVLTSPIMDASDGGTLTYSRWYNNGANCAGADPGNDIFVVEFSTDGGSSWTDLEVVGPSGDVNGGWTQAQFDLDALAGFTPTAAFRLRFTASDLNDGSIVEAGVDGITIDRLYCNDVSVPGDANGDGVVSVDDILYVISLWGDTCTDCSADLSGDGEIGVDDLLLIIANW